MARVVWMALSEEWLTFSLQMLTVGLQADYISLVQFILKQWK